MPRIAITGPESTGKTTLAAELARRLPHAAWVPEYARSYPVDLSVGGSYTLVDLEAIARGQLVAEDAVAATLPPDGWLVCDTDLLVILIWAEDRFGFCPEWLRRAALSPAAYAHRLLLLPDLLWEPDPLRTHPEPAARWELLARYRAALSTAGLPFTEVSGKGEARVSAALQALGALQATDATRPS